MPKGELAKISPKRLIILESGLHEIEIGYAGNGWHRYIKNKRTEIEDTRSELLVDSRGSRFFASMMKDMNGNKDVRILEFDLNGDPHSILVDPKDLKKFVEGLKKAYTYFELQRVHKQCVDFNWYPMWESKWHEKMNPKNPQYFKCSICGWETKDNDGSQV